MSKPTVTPEKLQRWDELTRAALVQTNPLIEQPLGVAMARAEWGAACVLAMPALIAEVKRLTAELAQTQALLGATQPFAHDVDVLHGILSDERQRAEAAERKLNDVLPQYVAQMADAIKRAEAAEQERDGAITLLGKQVMENTFIHQRLDAVAVDAAKARVRVAELESQLAAVTAQRDALQVAAGTLVRLRDDTDNILWSLKPEDIDGAINWGDLGTRETQQVIDESRQWYRVVIEEADPVNPVLHAAVLAGLVALGWRADDVEIETEW